jgi:release factor glutamine methyltransferase
MGGDARLPVSGEPWTPILLTRWSGEYLRGRGVESGRLDAELLLAHVLEMKRLDLYLQHDRPLLPTELESFKALLKRRATREPLQHILGTATFRELELAADRRALIPRPETELLVEEVLIWARGRASGGLMAADIGTGTGAIALSLLREGPFQRVVATDTSTEALDLARKNARALGLEERVDFREGALFDPLDPGTRFDALVSNPPYIAEGDREGLDPEVRDWDPPSALFAGPEGLDVLLPLVTGASGFLRPGGLLAVEVGEGQAGRVARTMEETEAFREIRVRPDLAGRERVVLGVA